MNTILRVFAYVRRYPWMAAGTLGCAVLSTGLVIVFPKTTQHIIDDVVRGHHPEKLWFWVLVGAGAFLAQHLFNALRIVLNNTFEQRVIFDLRSELYGHIQRLPLTWFDNRATGDLMTRVLEDVTAVERMLIDGIEQGVVAVLQIVIVAVVMAQTSPRLAGLVMLPMPLLAGGAGLYADGARALPEAAGGLLQHELAAARQSGGHPADQDVCARARGARAV